MRITIPIPDYDEEDWPPLDDELTTEVDVDALVASLQAVVYELDYAIEHLGAEQSKARFLTQRARARFQRAGRSHGDVDDLRDGCRLLQELAELVIGGLTERQDRATRTVYKEDEAAS